MDCKLCNMKSLLPFLGMVTVMFLQVSTMEVTKLAISYGINKYVLVVYSDALSALLLLPCSLIAHRSDRTPVTFSLLCSFFLLSIFGCSAQIFGYVGLQYSSPMLGTAMLNLIPAFTFLLAVIFRLETLDYKSKSSIAKFLGTAVSISGAFVVTFYKGPTLFASVTPPNITEPHQLLHSSQLFWIIGASFLAAEAFLNSAWYILQTFILKKFPQVLTIIFYLFLFNTLLSGIFAWIVVKDASSWKIKADVGLLAILYSAIVGLALRISLTTWCLSKTGPLYVSMFKPLAIVFAVIMDAIYLKSQLSLGSLIGGIIIVMGFYSVMWGKSKDGKTDEDSEITTSVSFEDKVPLLRNKLEDTA